MRGFNTATSSPLSQSTRAERDFEDHLQKFLSHTPERARREFSNSLAKTPFSQSPEVENQGQNVRKSRAKLTAKCRCNVVILSAKSR
jgi:hypothetical protein